MSTAKSTQVSNFEAAPALMNNIANLGGIMRVACGSVALAVGDVGANDIVHLTPIPTNASIISIKLFNDDFDTGTDNTASVGLYTTAAAVVDIDAYASVVTDLRGIVTAGTELAFEARNVNVMGQKVWQDAGASVDPGGYYYLSVTFPAAGTTAGDLSWAITYVID